MPLEPPPTTWRLPDPGTATPGSDVVGVGADLEPGTILAAYRLGLFPMHIADGPLGWWSPDPRGILPLSDLRVTRSLRRSCRVLDVTVDRAFDDVVAGCAQRPDSDGSWITDDIARAYAALHELGWAHSVEVWRGAHLVGGLYGIEVGGLFAGESMFHRERDASKVALVGLVERLRAASGPRLLDVQWRTDHLASLGVVEVPRTTYLELLAAALPLDPVLS